MKYEIKADALQCRLYWRQDPMKPTSGSIPNISGNMSSKWCYISQAETVSIIMGVLDRHSTEINNLIREF